MRHIKIPLIDNKLAYLCGVFAGDGSINVRENKNEYLLKCVGNPKDEKEFYFKIIGPNFEQVFGLIPRVRDCDGKTTFGFIVYSKELVNYLNKTIGMPIGQKYEQLAIPKLFLKDNRLLISFIRGVFDTDGCICFKKKYQSYPYYPVISLSSKSKFFIQKIATFLKNQGFKVVETYDYKVTDNRIKLGFTIINRLELNGNKNLGLWMKNIGFFSPKHLSKIKKYWKESSGRWI